MSRPSKLNWEASRGKWKIVYQGTKYRFDGGTGKSDREAKKRAEEAWKKLKAQVDQDFERTKPHRLEYENVIAEWTMVLNWAMEHGDGTTAAVARGKLDDLESRLADRAPPALNWSDRFFAGPAPLVEKNERMEPVYREAGLVPIQCVEGPVPSELTLWKDRLEAQGRRKDEKGWDETFAANIEQFLNERRTEAAAGQLSAARADSLRTYLNVVMGFTGRTTSVRNIDGGMVAAIRTHLLQRVATKEISDYYARDVFATFKLFVRWLASTTEHLEHLPKNIDDEKLKIVVAKRKAKTLTMAQIKRLTEEASSRTRLYLLLGLNCAMTQIDMSELQQEQVEWELGVITRKRTKTEDYEGVPIVSYPLWPSTFELLKQERSSDQERVLITRDGRPLRTDVIGTDNRLKKTDAVRLAIRRLSTKTGISFTLKALKKTSASLLRANRDYQGLESLFLDHAPKTMAEKHYTTVPQVLLNEAIGWLGEELGVATCDEASG